MRSGRVASTARKLPLSVRGADNSGACDAAGPLLVSRACQYRGASAIRRPPPFFRGAHRYQFFSEEMFATLPPGGIGSFGRFPAANMKILLKSGKFLKFFRYFDSFQRRRNLNVGRSKAAP